MNRRFRNRSARHFGTGQGISPAMRRPVKRASRQAKSRFSANSKNAYYDPMSDSTTPMSQSELASEAEAVFGIVFDEDPNALLQRGAYGKIFDHFKRYGISNDYGDAVAMANYIEKNLLKHSHRANRKNAMNRMNHRGNRRRANDSPDLSERGGGYKGQTFAVQAMAYEVDEHMADIEAQGATNVGAIWSFPQFNILFDADDSALENIFSMYPWVVHVDTGSPYLRDDFYSGVRKSHRANRSRRTARMWQEGGETLMDYEEAVAGLSLPSGSRPRIYMDYNDQILAPKSLHYLEQYLDTYGEPIRYRTTSDSMDNIADWMIRPANRRANRKRAEYDPTDVFYNEGVWEVANEVWDSRFLDYDVTDEMIEEKIRNYSEFFLGQQADQTFVDMVMNILKENLK